MLNALSIKKFTFFLLAFGFLSLAGCATNMDFDKLAWWKEERKKVIAKVSAEFARRDVKIGSPVYIRIFKQSSILQLWLKDKNSNHYSLYKTYPICRYSGSLGPKLKEGDKQSPEGFYTVTEDSLNPNSQYHLSFNIHYPNAYDKAYGRTGSYIMVHGDCKSVGCYAMTDPQIEEIYAIVELALQYGQEQIPVHVFPFHMTEENLLMHLSSPWYPFWRNLQEGYLMFEETKQPPVVTVQNGRYIFTPPYSHPADFPPLYTSFLQ